MKTDSEEGKTTGTTEPVQKMGGEISLYDATIHDSCALWSVRRCEEQRPFGEDRMRTFHFIQTMAAVLGMGSCLTACSEDSINHDPEITDDADVDAAELSDADAEAPDADAETGDLCEQLSQEQIDEMGLDCGIIEVCPLGQKTCDGLNAQECQSVGHGTDWITVETCEKNCLDGECVTSGQPVCTVGEFTCSGSLRMVCKEEIGAVQWDVNRQCPELCRDGDCVCAAGCTPDSFKCVGKNLNQCRPNEHGCHHWSQLKTCESHCDASMGLCTEELPTCQLKNNSRAEVIHWVDGDTVWVGAFKGDQCNDFKYDSEKGKWIKVRLKIRVVGIDAPECKKKQDADSNYWSCTRNSSYSNSNEPYGYEAREAAVSLLPKGSIVTLTCDNPKADGSCPLDDTDEERTLAYIGYEKDQASYDFSIEMARLGMAFANTKFPSSKLKEICAAQQEAQNAQRGLWATGGLSQMGSDKRNGLSDMAKLCQKAMSQK